MICWVIIAALIFLDVIDRQLVLAYFQENRSALRVVAVKWLAVIVLAPGIFGAMAAAVYRRLERR